MMPPGGEMLLEAVINDEPGIEDLEIVFETCGVVCVLILFAGTYCTAKQCRLWYFFFA